MKTTLNILLCGILLCSTVLKAQNTTNKIEVHKVWITLIDGSKVKGNLYSADKLGLKITDNVSFDISNLIDVDAEKIDQIKIRRKGKIVQSTLKGGLYAAVFGGLIGLASDGDGGYVSFSKGEMAAAGAVIFGVLGSGIGALVGTYKEKITINGNLKNYERQLEVIQRYSLRPINKMVQVN